MAGTTVASLLFAPVSPVPPVFAIVLGAGQSSRFGSDKLLAPLQGRPVLAHVLETAAASARDGILRAVFVVVRDPAGPEARLGQDSGAIPVVADRAGDGLALSLRAGLERVASTAPANGAAALVLLGDQPAVRREVIAEVVRRWRATGADSVRPRYADCPLEPGHPVLLDRRLWPEVVKLEGDTGPARLLPRTAVELVDVPGRNPGIDTLADLAAFPLVENA
jgi:molybdenum cofactor cytidylyltransferase